MVACVGSFSVTLVAKPWHHYPSGRRSTTGQKVQVFGHQERPVEIKRRAAAPSSPAAEFLRDARGSVSQGRAVETFIVEAESNIVPAPGPTRTVSRQPSLKHDELANLIRRLEEHEKEACAIVKDDKHLQSSKLQAIAVLAKTAKAIITDMHKENLRLHAALRRAEFERQQADNAVRGAADTLMSYQNQIASAKMAERVDILEHLEKCRKDNARLQAEVQNLLRERSSLEKKLEHAKEKLLQCEIQQE